MLAQGGEFVGSFQSLVGQTDDAGGGAVLLDTAPLAAAADVGFLTVQHQMADLRAGAVSAVEELAIDDDAAADAGAQGCEDHVLGALAAALPEFAQSGNVGVVTGLDGEAHQLGQSLGDVENAPAQVNTLVDHALAVDGTGHADAHADDGGLVNVLLVDELQDGGCDIGQDALAVVGHDGGDLPLVEHGAVFVKVGDLYSGAAQIHTEAVSHFLFPPKNV